GAGGTDRLALRPDERGGAALAAPGLDRPADEVAEEGERRPEEEGHEEGHVPAVHLEGHPEPDEGRDVDGPPGGAPRGPPPPCVSEGRAGPHVVASSSQLAGRDSRAGRHGEATPDPWHGRNACRGGATPGGCGHPPGRPVRPGTVREASRTRREE